MIEPTRPLPITGTVELDLPIAELWASFVDVPRWPEWNRCMHRAKVKEGELRQGATLVWSFNAIKPALLYKLPARAEIVEFEPHAVVAWEVKAPGFHALHRYLFADLGDGRSSFGSWEVAEGPTYKLLKPFWLAHFRYVCRESLAGAQRLAGTQDRSRPEEASGAS